MSASHDNDFMKIADSFVAYYLKTNPVLSSFIGDHKNDENFSSFTPAALKSKQDRLGKFKDALKKVNRRQLSADCRVGHGSDS